MSKRRVYSQTTLDVMQRFFDAFAECKQRKLIGTVTEYCSQHSIDKAHFYTQRKDLNRGFFEIGWAVPLIDHCAVSAHWLLTGKGTMFLQ